MPTMQVCRRCGSGAPADAHFCPQCSGILELDRRQGDYFAFLGLPRKLRIEPADLEQRYRLLSRQLHPDYFCTADPADRRASLDRSSRLNDAYRVLHAPVSRIGYLLDIENAAAGGASSGTTTVRGGTSPPPALLEEVFALNEEIEDVRRLRAGGAPRREWAERLNRARQPIDAKRADHEAELEALSARWDEAVDTGAPEEERRRILIALRERFLERNYINNLVAGIERELAE